MSAFDIREKSVFPRGFHDVQYPNTLAKWLGAQNFDIKKDAISVTGSSVVLKTAQKGPHVNFVPELVITWHCQPTGSVDVHIAYSAKVLAARAALVGVLTGGLSAAVGIGTGAKHYSEAREFVLSIWQRLDSLAHVKGIKQVDEDEGVDAPGANRNNQFNGAPPAGNSPYDQAQATGGAPPSGGMPPAAAQVNAAGYEPATQVGAAPPSGGAPPVQNQANLPYATVSGAAPPSSAGLVKFQQPGEPFTKVIALKMLKQLTLTGKLNPEQRTALSKKVLQEDGDAFAMMEALQDDMDDLAENLKIIL